MTTVVYRPLQNYRWLQKETAADWFEYGIEIPGQTREHLKRILFLVLSNVSKTH